MKRSLWLLKMDDTDIIAVIVVIIIVLVVGYYIYLYIEKPIPPVPPPSGGTIPDAPINPVSGTLTDCAKYGTPVTPTACPAGTQEYAGYCYTDVWSQYGGTKTAVCTVDYPGGIYLHTQCGIGIYYLNIGDPCPMVGDGWFKTATCTCQYGGPITSSEYCQSRGKPSVCPSGSDTIPGASSCYSTACPVGYVRTGRCTCSPN